MLYGCTTWRLTKRTEKNIDGNYTRMLRAILSKSWRQHTTKLQLCGPLPPVTKSIKVRRINHAGRCWGSRDELISDIFRRTSSHRRAKVGRQARNYIQQLFADTGCSMEDLPGVMDDKRSGRYVLAARLNDDNDIQVGLSDDDIMQIIISCRQWKSLII